MEGVLLVETTDCKSHVRTDAFYIQSVGPLTYLNTDKLMVCERK